MLTIRPTLMLARRLHITVPRTPPPVANRVADWCAHQFNVGHTRYLIFCHTVSLYPVITHARGVTDENDLIKRLVETLRSSLTGTELEFQYQRWIAPEWTQVQWAPIPGRAILGSINELVYGAKAGAAWDKCSPVELGPKLAKTPMKVLGWNSPDRVFPKLTGGTESRPTI
jgi:hypothetical protein